MFIKYQPKTENYNDGQEIPAPHMIGRTVSLLKNFSDVRFRVGAYDLRGEWETWVVYRDDLQGLGAI